MSLPITMSQFKTLRNLRHTHPQLGMLAADIALAFDASSSCNSKLVRLILENCCQRIVSAQPGSHRAMIHHLRHFHQTGSISSKSLKDFISRINDFD
jgi:hypothetical protein